jgi:hypothetical protein
VKTVVLVGCGKSKLDHAAPAKDLYTSSLFKKARAYAEREGDAWAILSAKNFLVMPDEVIEPYEQEMGKLDPDRRRQWQIHVNYSVRSRWPQEDWRYVALVGELYKIGFQWPSMLPTEYPLDGMMIGERLQFLTPSGGRARNDASNAESVPGVAPAPSAVQGLLFKAS